MLLYSYVLLNYRLSIFSYPKVPNLPNQNILFLLYILCKLKEKINQLHLEIRVNSIVTTRMNPILTILLLIIQMLQLALLHVPQATKYAQVSLVLLLPMQKKMQTKVNIVQILIWVLSSKIDNHLFLSPSTKLSKPTIKIMNLTMYI